MEMAATCTRATWGVLDWSADGKPFLHDLTNRNKIPSMRGLFLGLNFYASKPIRFMIVAIIEGLGTPRFTAGEPQMTQ